MPSLNLTWRDAVTALTLISVVMASVLVVKLHIGDELRHQTPHEKRALAREEAMILIQPILQRLDRIERAIQPGVLPVAEERFRSMEQSISEIKANQSQIQRGLNRISAQLDGFGEGSK